MVYSKSEVYSLLNAGGLTVSADQKCGLPDAPWGRISMCPAIQPTLPT